MKNNVKIILGVIILVLAGSLITYFLLNDNKKEYVVTEESLQFEKEYEELNGTVNPNNEKEYISIDAPANAPIKYTNYDEVFEILENGTGVIYFGFPECPWCRNFVPALVSSAMDYGLETIFYMNNREDRNLLSLTKKEKIKTEEKGSDEYLKLIELLDEYLPVYQGLKDDTIKRLYFPTVLFVKNGEVIGVEQSLDSYSERVKGDPYLSMNNEEVEELSNLFKDYYQKLEAN